MDGPELGIIIPAFNEGRTIGAVVARVRAHGLPIVVDDASADGTDSIAREAGAEVVRHEVNQGYDAALNSGFRRAAELECRYLVTMDADGQHDAGVLDAYLERLRSSADVVVGIRDRRQRLSEHVFAWVTRFLYGIHDPLCGMKGYRLSVYRLLGHFDSFGSIGTELALFAARSGLRIEQLPVPTRQRDGAPRFGRLLLANFWIFRAMLLSLVKIRPARPGRA